MNVAANLVQLSQDEILTTTRCGIHAWSDHGIGKRKVQDCVNE